MTKDYLIKKVLDSAVSGSKKEAEDAIDEYFLLKQGGYKIKLYLAEGLLKRAYALNKEDIGWNFDYQEYLEISEP